MDDEFEQSRKHNSSKSVTSGFSQNREMKEEAVEAGHQFAPIIRPDGQIRQRQGQQIQQNKHQTRGNMLRTLSIKVQAGLIGGNLPTRGRHLPIHGGHPQNGI